MAGSGEEDSPGPKTSMHNSVYDGNKCLMHLYSMDNSLKLILSEVMVIIIAKTKLLFDSRLTILIIENLPH